MKTHLLRRWMFVCLILVCAAAFAQEQTAPPPPAQPQVAAPEPSIFSYFFGYGFIIQIIAVIHWAKRSRDRMWIWVILIGGFIGALAYFVVEALPDVSQVNRALKAPSRRRRITILRAMVRDNPSAGNFEELGELLIQEKKWAEARTAFDNALKSRTDLLDTFYWRGVATFELGDDAAAISDFQHVVKHEPKYDYLRAMTFLARAHARAGHTLEATTTYDRLTDMTTLSESLVHAAEFYAEHGKADKARQLVESVLARRPTMPHYQKRREREWLRRAARLERRLKKEAASPQTAAA